MSNPIVKPVADPLADIDRVAPVDSLMARQDCADLPGNRSDIPDNDNPRPLDADVPDDAAQPQVDPDEVAVGQDAASTALDDPDVAVALENAAAQPVGRGPDDDDPIEEIERMGDDSLTP
ncbi:MAG TPA: hypothetical protein VF457_06335 [Burkholderiaceae bacterium]